jgi:hypothetical protein
MNTFLHEGIRDSGDRLPMAPGSMVGHTWLEAISRFRFRVDFLRVSELWIDTLRFQFKGSIDAQGVVLEERLQGKYNELAAGCILVWEDVRGVRWVLNGHHRFDLARRCDLEFILAMVLREVDGCTEEIAAALAAETNILDGHGTVGDFARYFWRSDLTEEEAKNRGLLSRAKGRDGWAIGVYATEDLRTWYFNHVEDGVEKVVAGIARAVPYDPHLQRLGLNYYINDRASSQMITLYLHGLQSLPAGAKMYAQPDLFGLEPVLAEEKLMAETAAKLISELNRYKSILNQAISKSRSLELTDAEAARWRITDKRDMEQIKNAHKKVKGDLAEWERYRCFPEKVRLVREKAGLIQQQPLMEGREEEVSESRRVIRAKKTHSRQLETSDTMEQESPRVTSIVDDQRHLTACYIFNSKIQREKQYD